MIKVWTDLLVIIPARSETYTLSKVDKILCKGTPVSVDLFYRTVNTPVWLQQSSKNTN